MNFGEIAVTGFAYPWLRELNVTRYFQSSLAAFLMLVASIYGFECKQADLAQGDQVSLSCQGTICPIWLAFANCAQETRSRRLDSHIGTANTIVQAFASAAHIQGA